MGVGGKCNALATLSLEKETQYPLYRGLGGTQGWSGWTQKILPPIRFDLQNHPACSKSLY